MAITLLKSELCDIKCAVEQTFVNVEEVHSKLNELGSKDNMEYGNELMMYVYLMNEVTSDDSDFRDDTYMRVLTNKDIQAMYDRVLWIRSNINRLTVR